MRNQLVKRALFILLAALFEFGCLQSVANSQPRNKKADKARPENAQAASAATGGPKIPPLKSEPRPPGGAQPALAESVDEKQPSNNDNPAVGSSTSGVPWWLTKPMVLLLIGLLIFLGLALHIVHILAESRFKREFAELYRAVQLLSQRLSMADETERNAGRGGSNELTQRLNRHRQGLDQLGMDIQRFEQRITETERQASEVSTATALAAHLAGQPRIARAMHQPSSQDTEADRATAIKIAERYADMFGANATRTLPLIQETSDLAEWLNRRLNLPPELTARVEELRADVLRFERWHSSVSDRLASLRQGSVSDRYARFSASHTDLARQFDAQAISIADYVKGYGELLERHFPAAEDGSGPIAPHENEEELRGIVAGIPDYLMNWFDRLYQLQAQAVQAAIDAETAGRLTRIVRTARDVLGKFDIQPEEIQLGVTSFDRRLHDASLITQSPQYPTNTVVGVQEYGFRKLSTGDVLRRPKVIVAGVGAAL